MSALLDRGPACVHTQQQVPMTCPREAAARLSTNQYVSSGSTSTSPESGLLRNRLQKAWVWGQRMKEGGPLGTISAAADMGEQAVSDTVSPRDWVLGTGAEHLMCDAPTWSPSSTERCAVPQ